MFNDLTKVLLSLPEAHQHVVLEIAGIAGEPDFFYKKPGLELPHQPTLIDKILQPLLNLFGTAANSVQIPEIESAIKNLRVPIRFNAHKRNQYVRYTLLGSPNIIMDELVEISSPHLFIGHRATQEYYYAVFHEITHWTAPRMGRPCDNDAGSIGYMLEESIANFGSAMLMYEFGIWDDDIRKKHAAYLVEIQMVLAGLVSEKFTQEFNKYNGTNFNRIDLITHLCTVVAKDASDAVMWCVREMKNPTPWWKRLLNIS